MSREAELFLIKYKADGIGCPDNGVHGELKNYNWNSNNFSDPRFPQTGVVLEFYAAHKNLDTDFFYFGSEFICSEDMLKVIKAFRHGSIDVIEVIVHLQRNKPSASPKRYFLLRSREIRSVLDKTRSAYELRADPATGQPELDLYHHDRYIYDSISKFIVSEKNIDLDFFICSEMLMHEYVFSLELKRALEAAKLTGISFLNIEETVYDAKLEF